MRHRTDAKGELLRSEHFGGKGLIFAKDKHKRALSRSFFVPAHTITIPARPYLGLSTDDVGDITRLILARLAADAA